MNPEILVGMDVSQDTVDIGVQPWTTFQIVHDEPGITTTVQRLQAL